MRFRFECPNVDVGAEVHIVKHSPEEQVLAVLSIGDKCSHGDPVSQHSPRSDRWLRLPCHVTFLLSVVVLVRSPSAIYRGHCTAPFKPSLVPRGVAGSALP